MKERIRQLRKVLNLNQTDFGNKIGVKQTTIAGYETGAKNPLDSVILSICREFNVNEEWLRNGEGEMFRAVLEEDELATYCADICSGKDPFIANTILEYMRLEDNDRKAIRDFIKSIAEGL